MFQDWAGYKWKSRGSYLGLTQSRPLPLECPIPTLGSSPCYVCQAQSPFSSPLLPLLPSQLGDTLDCCCSVQPLCGLFMASATCFHAGATFQASGNRALELWLNFYQALLFRWRGSWGGGGLTRTAENSSCSPICREV
jgi:hypothetical protein